MPSWRPIWRFTNALLTASVSKPLGGLGMTMPAVANGVRNGGVKTAIILEWTVKVFALLAPILFGALLTLYISGERRLDSHEVALGAIEASRFTAGDGADIQRQMANMVTRPEFLTELREIRQRLDMILEIANGR